MVSATAAVRSGYYVLKMLPSLLWLPINIRKNIRHMTTVFEEQLIQSGLDQEISHELARAFHDANKQIVSQITSPRSWTR